MTDIFIYILKVALAFTAFVSVLYFPFKNTSGYTLKKRVYLGCVLLAFVLPLSQYQWEFPVEVSPQVIISEEVSFFDDAGSEEVGVYMGDAPAKPLWMSFVGYLPLFYVSGFLVFMIRLGGQLSSLYQKTKDARIIKINGVRCYKVEGREIAFSAFGKIFIGNQFDRLSPNEQAQILKHEEAHIRLGHSWEKIFLSVSGVLLWFHPGVWFGCRRVAEWQEYEVDKCLANTEGTKRYLELLFNLSFLKSTDTVDMANMFNSFTKKRMEKLAKPDRRLSKRHLIPLIPVVALAFMGFSFTAKEVPAVSESLEKPLPSSGSLPEWLNQTMIVFKDSGDLHFVAPIQRGAAPLKITSKFGKRFFPFDKKGNRSKSNTKARMHSGVDIKAKIGTPIRAAEDGVVEKVNLDASKPRGLYVYIRHNSDYVTLYSHLSKVNVKVGELVKDRGIVGLSGNTGMSTGPHLHFEILKDGKPVDPMDYLLFPPPPPPPRNPKGRSSSKDDGC
ncbi:hypothetical protein FUAX_50280 (plasmid) [Fulvitalea axinellae]|uniref:Uncharacterized protein n=1 Tax=Fulvitalea axinellae TaxID=1182444 RepID=A0AAU9DHL6_9BACT|nr:hypothetical protein FUAX_50280 [Fulvitalea axinellae]